MLWGKLTVIAALMLLGSGFVLAMSDAQNGDWDAEYVVLHNTSEAELMVRVGSINNVGFGFPDDVNPFTAARAWQHPFPWDPPAEAAEGTDRIMLGTSYAGVSRDGYSYYWRNNQQEATTRPIAIRFDTAGIKVRNALLQITVDDFQALSRKSHFTATLNGEDAPFIAEVLNQIDQTGPVVQVMSVEIPEVFLPAVAAGSLDLFIDETTGIGDGFAIDFVKLLVNYGRTEYVSFVEGTVKNAAGEPLAGALVRVLGTRNVQMTDADGAFSAEVVAGINAFRASHEGHVEAFEFKIIPAGGHLRLPFSLQPGEGNPDLNYLDFAPGDGWSRASDWAVDELELASRLQLIPAVLVGADLTGQITRAEFAAVAVRLYENLSGVAAESAAHNPFTDTDDLDVLKAFNTDLAVGISPTLFNPDALLNREQAATILTRVFKKVHLPGWTWADDAHFNLEFDQPQLFADHEKISEWARDSVYFMAGNGIITGTGGNNFTPRAITPEEVAMNYASTTREQALVLTVRMAENLGDD